MLSDLIRWGPVVLSIPALACGAITINICDVGSMGNVQDSAAHSGNTSGLGSVSYKYSIGRYEVTTAQYVAFLNAVAKTDTYGLYDAGMSTATYNCGIQRTGTSGSYVYSISTDRENRPVNYVNWGDAARFTNWLHNGQPTGTQSLTTTEDGAYFLNGKTDMTSLANATRKAGAKWAIPTESEWYKAAYFDPSLNSGTGGYWDYPTRNNFTPGRDINDPNGNNANYMTGASPASIDSGYFMSNAGEFQNSTSAFGTYDQGGNVWEWNELTKSGSFRGARGGSFATNTSQMQSSIYNTTFPNTTFIADFGFRVVLLPESSFLAPLVISAALLITRRGR